MISIIIPTYNRPKLLKKTLLSIVNQSSKNYEIIVVDDHSNSETLELLNLFSLKYSILKVFRRKNTVKGASACRNEGIDHAEGNFIMFLDSDDIMHKDCIKNRESEILNHPNHDYYIFPVALFADGSKEANYLSSNYDKKDDLEGFINYTGGWHTSSSVIKAEVLKNCHYFNDRAYSWQDVEFHIRLLLKSLNYCKFSSINPDIFVRISDNNPRISNLPWTPEKIFNRLEIVVSIEKEIDFAGKMTENLNFVRIYSWLLFQASRQMSPSNFSKTLNSCLNSSTILTEKMNKSKILFLKIANKFINYNSLFEKVFVKIAKRVDKNFFYYPQKKEKLKFPIAVYDD